MNCKSTKKKLLRLIDDELPMQDRKKVLHHLDSCEACADALRRISDMWGIQPEFQKCEPDQYAWQKLYVKISEQEAGVQQKGQLSKRLTRLALTGGLAALLVFSIFAGIYLGSEPMWQADNELSSQSAEQEFVKMVHIDSFEDVPPGSLGSVYMSISAETK